MAKAQARTDIFAGLFMLIGLTLFALSIWIIGAERQIFARQEGYEVTYRDIKGLNEGAPVRLGGITIGRVDKIGFATSLADPNVHVTLLINEEYVERIREDSEISIETQGLLGDKFVSISAGRSSKQLLPGAVIQGRESGDFGAVLGKAERVVENTVEASEQFKRLIAEFREKSLDEVTGAFRGLSEIAKEINEGQGLLNRIVYSKKDGDKIMESITSTTAMLKEFSQQVKSGEGLLHAIIYGTGGQETLDGIKGSAQGLSSASASIAELLAEIKSGNGLLHYLIYERSPDGIKEVITKLNRTADNFERASIALASGSGTLGALLFDAKLYDNLVEVTGEAKRSIILRSAIRSALDQPRPKNTDDGARLPPLPHRHGE